LELAVKSNALSISSQLGSEIAYESHDVARSTDRPILASLSRYGWTRYVATGADTAALVDEMFRLGDLLGTRARGRAGISEELIQPQTSEVAHPRSLSAQYGLNALPFHVELSYRTRPCRYLLLGCIDPGSPGTLTKLLDWRTLGFSPKELHLLESAPILVRSGRRSFYSTILCYSRTLLRYDPGCLEAVDERGRAVLRLVEHRLALGSSRFHEWRRGDILIIDNWRILHGRGPTQQGSGRRLARLLIND
jgi:hypothetical protein